MNPLPRALLLALACVVLAAAPARAADTDLGPAPGVAGLTATAGRLVFSQLDPSGAWHLERLAGGAVTRLPVPPSAAPFDADAGTDAAGRPVVTFSRCTPGCDGYVLPLTGTPTARRLPGVNGTHPSMWRGAVAYVTQVGRATPRVELLALGAKRPVRLSGGTVQTCIRSCAEPPPSTQSVDALDLGPRRVAYVWRLSYGSTAGTGLAWELRSAGRDGRLSELLDSGEISGTCGFHQPYSPSAEGTDVTFATAGSDSECDDVVTTQFVQTDPATGILATAATPGGIAAETAQDGATTYWLRATALDGMYPCTDPADACELVASTPTGFTPQAAADAYVPAETDLIASRLGYRWTTGPHGVQLLVPPASLPCAPSAAPAYVQLAARWPHSTHTVILLRTDQHRGARRLGVTQGRTAGGQTILACGQRTQLSYVVDGARRSFTVTRGGR